MAFFEASEESLKMELATTTLGSTRLGQLFDSISDEVVDLQETLAARDDVARFNVEGSCPTIGTSLRGLVRNFRAGHNQSVNGALRDGFIYSQFYADTAIDVITLSFSVHAASEGGGVQPRMKTLLIACSSTRSSKSRKCFPFRTLSVNCDSGF